MKLEIPIQNDTDVYASDVGYVCISQHNPCGENDLVIMAIHNVDTLCQMIQDAKAQAIQNRNAYLSRKNLE